MDPKEQALQDFLAKVNHLKTQAIRHRQCTESEWNEHILKTHFPDLHPSEPSTQPTSVYRTVRRRKWTVCIIGLLAALLIASMYGSLRQATSSIFMKNIQPFIYPGMSVWRMITVPVIALFPGLTQLYDESCLVSNPLFQIQDMDCRPCQNVLNVLTLSDEYEHQVEVIGGGVPYVFKADDDSPKISVDLLHRHFLRHADVYRQDAHRVVSTNPLVKTLDDMFADFQNGSATRTPSHTMWRCNRMNPLRLLRPLIRHPSRLPRTGMSIERFLAVDMAGAPSYSIPDTECSNVFVYQVLGSRTLILRPTSECSGECRTISVKLSESHVLLYDWWYWKPMSIADQDQLHPTMSYIGAYC